MIKRFWKILVVSFIAMLFFVNTANSQALTYEKAYDDYVFITQQYRDAHELYAKKRVEYLQFETLTSRDAAQVETVAMLRARDDLVRVYLTALRTRMVEIDGLSSDEKESFYTKIDPEVAWYQSHRINYSDTDSIDTLIAKSDVASARYEKITNLLVHDMLFALSLADIVNQRDLHAALSTRIGLKVKEIKIAGDKETEILERWIGDIVNRLASSEISESDAVAAYDKIRQRERKIEEGFSNGVNILGGSLRRIGEANGFLQEIITEIKVAD